MNNNNNDLDLTDSGHYVNSSSTFEDDQLFATQLMFNEEFDDGGSSFNNYDIIPTGPPSNHSFSDATESPNKIIYNNSNINNSNNKNTDNNDNSNNYNNHNDDDDDIIICDSNNNDDKINNNNNNFKSTTTTTTTTISISSTTSNNKINSLFNKRIEFDKVKLYIKDNVIYKCRFLLSRNSKIIDLKSEDTQRRVQKLVFILLLKKGEVIFLRDRDILVSLRLHTSNSMRNKLSIKDKFEKLIEVDRNKYTFIIQRL